MFPPYPHFCSTSGTWNGQVEATLLLARGQQELEGGVLEMGSIHVHGEREEVGQIPVRERITLTNNCISNRAFLIFNLGSSATFASGSVGFKLES